MMSPAGRTTALLFLFFQSVYALASSGNAFRVPDEFEVYFQVEHLVDAGDLSVPQTLAVRQPVVVNGRVVGTQPIFFGKFGRDGKPYAPYGPAAAFLLVPHHAAARVVAWVAGIPRAPLPDGTAWVVLVGGLTMIASATAAALAVAGFHRAALSLGAAPRVALTVSLLLGGATILWTYGTTLYGEAWQAAAFVWAAALLLDARAGARQARFEVIAAAVLLAIAGLTKVTSLVFAPGFVVAALVDRSAPMRRRLDAATCLALGIALAVAVHVAWNLHRFGAPFDFGYDWGETIPRPPARAFDAGDLPRGLVVLLLSPGKSLFLWAPALVLALSRLPAFWRRERAGAIGLAVSAGAGLIFFGAYLFPEGGYCHGPRHLLPIVPLLLLPAAEPGLTALRRSRVVACATIGLAMALLSTAVSFLEDQSVGEDLAGGARLSYYERIDPAPGRAWNRYRIGYVPFAGTLSSGRWLSAETLGSGPDVFPLHMAQARRLLPDGGTIPRWAIWGPSMGWMLLAAAAGLALRRKPRAMS